MCRVLSGGVKPGACLCPERFQNQKSMLRAWVKPGAVPSVGSGNFFEWF
ncbi:hypothetical protein ES703_54958 [subsurface metagenome]